jgi:hypothetical protein
MTVKRPSWLRSVEILLAAFVTWVALSVLTYRDGPDDKPLIVSMLSKGSGAYLSLLHSPLHSLRTPLLSSEFAGCRGRGNRCQRVGSPRNNSLQPDLWNHERYTERSATWFRSNSNHRFASPYSCWPRGSCLSAKLWSGGRAVEVC